jgi:hypothetical protein
MTDNSDAKMTLPGTAGADLAYAFKPSLMGAVFEFWLRPQALEWRAGRRSGRISYRDIRRLRLSFRPVTMQSYRFRTEIWPEGAPKIEIVSSSWKSLVEQERLSAAYTAFVGELHRRIAASGAPVRLETGVAAPLYWSGLIVSGAVALGLAVLIVRALQVAAWSGAAFISAFLAVFLWQAGGYFRRNRPGSYRPDALPAHLLPEK